MYNVRLYALSMKFVVRTWKSHRKTHVESHATVSRERNTEWYFSRTDTLFGCFADGTLPKFWRRHCRWKFSETSGGLGWKDGESYGPPSGPRSLLPGFRTTVFVEGYYIASVDLTGICRVHIRRTCVIRIDWIRGTPLCLSHQTPYDWNNWVPNKFKRH